MQQTIQLQIPEGSITIDGYGSDGFTIQETLYPSDILLFQAHVQSFTMQKDAPLNIDSFTNVWALSPKPDLLLFGTGARHQFVPPFIRNYFKQAGIALEVMDSGAACRTYNILLAEGRVVAAFLLKP